MARDYIRNITDMERYFYGAGNAMYHRRYIPSNLR